MKKFGALLISPQGGYYTVFTLWQVVFVALIAAFYNVITIPPRSFFLFDFSAEYWSWLLEQPQSQQWQMIQSKVHIAGIIFILAFLLALGRLLYEKWSRKALLTFVKSALLGTVLQLLVMLIFSAVAEHCRLYMLYIPLEVYSIVILFAVRKIAKYEKG